MTALEREPSTSELAETHRAAAAGMAELTEHHADAVAALDRAVVARLGDLDRAIDARISGIDGHLSDAESQLAEAIETGVAEFRRAGSDERRILHEGVAARLAEVEAEVGRHLAELERVAAARVAELRELVRRVHELERAAAARIAELEHEATGPSLPGPEPGPQIPA